MENELQKVQDKLSATLDALPDMLFEVDRHGRIYDYRAPIEKMLYAPPKEFIGKTINQVLPKSVANVITKAITQAIEHGRHVGSIYSLDMSGEKRWFELSIAAKGDPKNPNCHLIALARDITKRKRAEDALRVAEERFRSILESLDDTIFTLDDRGVITYISPVIKQNFGYDPDEVLGNPLSCLLAPEDVQDMEMCFKHAIAGQFKSRNVRVISKKKQVRYVKFSCQPLQSGGQKFGFTGTITDITSDKLAELKLKESEDRLRQSEAKYRAIVEDMPNLICSFNSDGVLTFVNNAYCDYFQTGEEDLLGTSFLTLIPEPSRKTIWDTFTALNLQKPTLSYNHQVILPNEEIRWQQWTDRALFDQKNNIIEYQSIGEDITEQKKMEDELRKARDELEAKVKKRTEELERYNTEMERFVYTVSHDLKSPLVTISGFLGFLKIDMKAGDEDRVEKDLELIYKAVSKMDLLLSETLELSRIGRVVNPPKYVPFDQLVDEALGQTSEKIRLSGAKVSVAKKLPTVHVDGTRIIEVLVNLLENSIKYTSEKVLPKIEIGCHVDEDDAVFFVKDNGIGIDPRQKEKVFELFYRVDNDYDGAGAGLTIAKKIIEVHGGKIWIESELDRGCTICFKLPIA